MTRRKEFAADLVERYDGEVRVILGELVENAAKANMLWTLARLVARDDPRYAMTLLIDAEILLDTIVRIERHDSLRRIRSAINRLDAELPDDESGDEGTDSLK